MYKRKVTLIDENGYLHAMSQSIKDDFDVSKPKFYLAFEFRGDQLDVYCVSERYLKREVDEFCKWVEEHYNDFEVYSHES